MEIPVIRDDSSIVIPAKAGIYSESCMDPRLREDDSSLVIPAKAGTYSESCMDPRLREDDIVNE